MVYAAEVEEIRDKILIYVMSKDVFKSVWESLDDDVKTTMRDEIQDILEWYV